MKHVVKRSFWRDSVLVTLEEVFNNFEDALEYCWKIVEAKSVKIYNELGELVHVHKADESSDTYA